MALRYQLRFIEDCRSERVNAVSYIPMTLKVGENPRIKSGNTVRKRRERALILYLEGKLRLVDLRREFGTHSEDAALREALRVARRMFEEGRLLEGKGGGNGANVTG